VAVFYALCTLVEAMLPVQFAGFMNALFHGLDFSRLATPAPYAWTSFVYALVILSAWAFAAGTFFGWLHNALSGWHFRRKVRHG
jgi:ABC-type sugar transport system permease subunit